ncbi:MAG: bifunctional oligoribonuclease/PAP phosphatase NrnA [Lachnospiraceae bacterium]
MKLGNLEKYNYIVIQMHDNPDADAVGAGYSMYQYFKSKRKIVRLVYGGRTKITKSNMRMLIKELGIPVEYIKDADELRLPEYDKPELLLTVDCQYGEGNVWHIDAENVAMIDHHATGRVSDDMAEIRSYIVSCSAVCYDMLRAEGYDVNANIDVATVLYYGTFMDSNEFSEIRNPLERDMIDCLHVDKKLINRITHANFTMQELETAAIAMLRFSYDENKRLSIVKSKPCDPNILGLVGDMVLQVDSVDVCIIFSECDGGYKLSIRSCEAEVAANELAAYLTADIGNGGGHTDKAGGFINQKKYEEKYEDILIDSYIFKRVEQYYDSFEVVYAKDGISDLSEYALYKKKPYIYGYVRTTDLFEAGTECRIRTYEGDVFVTSDEDTYLMIGFFGEVYPIQKEAFEKKYTPLDESFNKSFEYEPSVRSLKHDKNFGILEYAKQCRSMGSEVYARLLDKPTKVFSRWDYDTYMYGDEGDYICCSCMDLNDIYIVKKEVFEEIYEQK